jgi:uncharacterized Ntn-hydrolase superfamily protein
MPMICPPRWTPLLVLLPFFLVSATSIRAQETFDPDYRATFSIVARDATTAELGHAEASKALAGGTNFGAAKGGVGMITNQASTFIMYGRFGIQMLEMGFPPEEALAFLLRADEDRERRQVAIIDIEGRTAAFTGSAPRDWKGHHCGVDYCVQGNSLSGPEVLEAMARSFETSTGSLAERLLEAVEAGESAGGDRRGKQEAYVLVVRRGASSGGFSDKVLEIRVDDHPEPVSEARRILNRILSGRIVQEANRRLAEGEVEAAFQSFRAAVELSPENDNAWMALTRAEAGRGRTTEALDALRRAVELNPGNRLMAGEDAALEPLRDNPTFRSLVEHPPSP